jgi:hypothetical protein
MRALIVSLILGVAVVICMAFVVLFAGLNANSAALASAGLGIFLVATLFAAIAALGPKSRPTPLLTPAIAGTAAAAVTTVAIITLTQIGQSQRAALTTSEPAKIDEPASQAAMPTPEAPPAASTAEPVQFPGVAIAPLTPTSVPTPTMLDADISSAKAEPEAPELTEDVGPAVPPSEQDVVGTMTDSSLPRLNLDIVPHEAGSSASTLPQPEIPVAASGSSATATIPIPPVPPPPTERPPLSEDAFDASRPPSVRDGTIAASPPLPRSRPCGAGGPPCP